MATTTAQIARTVTIGSNWEEDGSSFNYENAAVEAELALSGAPNVKELHWVYDTFGEFLRGIAVELTTGERSFFLSTGETMSFDRRGNLVL